MRYKKYRAYKLLGRGSPICLSRCWTDDYMSSLWQKIISGFPKETKPFFQ